MTLPPGHDRLPTITRFVTGHTAEGKATAQIVDKPEGIQYPERGRVFNVLYSTQTSPVRMQNDGDLKQHQDLASQGHISLVNKKGTTLRIVDFAPNTPAAMHRTQSLDYGIVLQGSVVMVMDDGEEHLMKTGDVAIQRATMHGWRNASSTEWCRMAFVLMAAEKFDVGGKAIGEDLGTQMSFLPSSEQN